MTLFRTLGGMLSFRFLRSGMGLSVVISLAIVSGSVSEIPAVGNPVPPTNGLSAQTPRQNRIESVDLTELALVRANDGGEADLYGISVAVDGVTAVVGARFGDGVVPNSGAVYVYTRTGNLWEIQQKLVAFDGAEGDNFGESVSIHGNTIIVGANSDADIPSGRSGSAYIFGRSLGEWTIEAKIKANDAMNGDNFGISVSIFGEVAVVGANLDDDNGSSRGSAYIFKKFGGAWSQIQRITAADGTANDQFGTCVDFDGQTIAVGAFSAAKASGAAYIFAEAGSNWAQQRKLTASGPANSSYFGKSIAVDLDHVVVGAPRADGDERGAAYIFVRNNTTWSLQAKLTPSDVPPLFYNFGSSVGISRDTVIVGAPGGGTRIGRAFVYTRHGSSWPEERKLVASNGLADDEFGYSVAVDGITAIGGAWRRDVPAPNRFQITGSEQGSAYLFQLPFPQHSTPSYDFDGDGRSDIGVYRPSDGTWYVMGSQAGFRATAFGLGDDLIAPADFDGDHIADIALFRPATGTWYYLSSANGTFVAIQFGQNGDRPRPGDFDSDGRADISVFRPSTGIWYRINSSNGVVSAAQFGQNDDLSLVADFDGDSKTDLAVFRPANSAFYWIESSTGQFRNAFFGSSGDLPALGDFDGDGKTDLSVFRPANGFWYRINSTNSQFIGIPFGASADSPVAADYDADGKTDLALYRPSTGTWYFVMSSTMAVNGVGFGVASDQPLPAAYLH